MSAPPVSTSGRLARFGGALIFLATIAGVAIQIFKQPLVNSTANGPLVVTYKPQQRLLEFSFYLTFDNKGYGSEVISQVNALLSNDALRKGEDYVPFANDHIIFQDSDGGSPSSAPLTINKESTRKLRCVIRQSVGRMSSQVLNTRGDLELSINLIGKKRYLNMFGEENVYRHRFCFDLSGVPLNQLGNEPQKFHSVNCP